VRLEGSGKLKNPPHPGLEPATYISLSLLGSVGVTRKAAHHLIGKELLR
jgi:hypothetical protein